MRAYSSGTVFAVGKKATKDGSVLVSHSDDGDPHNDARLIHVPAADHPAGAQRPIFYTPDRLTGSTTVPPWLGRGVVSPWRGAIRSPSPRFPSCDSGVEKQESFPRYLGSAMGPDYMPSSETTGYPVYEPIGYIDQVKHTFGYQSSSYGVINEHGVAVGESTCGAVFGTCGKNSTVGCEPGRKVGEALMSIDTLSYLAMERTTSSRAAVELMGSLATKYGFYGPPDSFEGSGESLVVADPDEAWAFQILSDPTGTSAIWAAQRLPDDHMTVVANMYTIREVDASDKANFILSPNLFDVAKSKKWWKEGTPFDFTKMYSGGEYAHKYYSGRRMWRGFQMAKPSLYRNPSRCLNDRRDMTKGVQAGPFGSPDRFSTDSKVKGSWERSIALYRTNAVYVQKLQHPSADVPPGLASVAWYGAGPAHYAVFVPVPSGFGATVKALKLANPMKFETSSMNWATRRIMDVCQVNFKAMHETVHASQLDLEKEGDVLIERLRSSKSSAAVLQLAIQEHANKALATWEALSQQLLFSYSSLADVVRGAKHVASRFGHVGDNSRFAENWKAMGYSDEWLEQSGYKDGPPPAPKEDKCPPKCDDEPEPMPATVV
eukprot:g9356.t1